MDEYREVTTDGWVDRVPFEYLDPSYTPYPLPQSRPSTQKDSGRRRRQVVADNNYDCQLVPKSLSSPKKQSNRKRRRLEVDNNNDSPQLVPQSLPSHNEQLTRKGPQGTFVNRDYYTESARRLDLDGRKDEPETLFTDWLTTSCATSAGEYISMLSFRTITLSNLVLDGNLQATSQTLLPPLLARQNELALQPHNLAGNRIEADTKATEEIKWCCTICDKGPFKGRPGWQKHEEKQHFPKYTAYCQPDIRMNGPNIYCSICNEENPQCSHAAIPRSAVCAFKSLSDRRFITKESFIGHLKTEHSLQSDCPEANEWERRPPKHVWACGFCSDQHSNGIEDRWRHLARHYKANCTIADWKHSAVTFKLLGQSFIVKEWFEHCRMMFSPETHPGKWPVIFWSDDEAKGLQERLTAGQEEDGQKLAEDAFNASQIGKQILQQQQQLRQQEQLQHQQHQQHQQNQQYKHHHQQCQQQQQQQQQERDILALRMPR